MLRRGSALPRLALITAAVAAAVAACGAPTGRVPVDTSPAPTDVAPSKTMVRSTPAAEVTFVQDAGGEGGESAGRVDTSVIAASGMGVRVITSLFTDPDAQDPEEVIRQTWDGSTLLSFDSMGDPQYVLYEAANEHPEAWNGMGLWSRDLIGPTTGTTCDALARDRVILKRDTVGYRCATVSTVQQDGFSADYWFDKDTGILLETGPLHAATFMLGPRMDSATFSTTPPAGSRATVMAARKPSSGGAVRVPPFNLELLPTGTARSANYAGHSYVLAFLDSDTLWDWPDSCPVCLAAIKALQQLTADGKKPAVLVVLVGGKGKPGSPLVPTGVSLTMANDPTPDLQNALGLSNQLAMAFVGPDGTVKVSYDSAPTEAQLKQAVAAIG